MGFNKNKLKVNLKLTINRLKLMEKKKTELALKARKEIADYIANGKEDRARIRVEHIIREDYLVEAMEIIELYCDLLLARFGLIETTKCVEPGLEEAICSILWVAPRLSSDIQELKVISDQLFMKYGKPYCSAARADEHDKVNQRLKLKMSYQAPPQLLVENYLVEIAKSHNVPFEPDPTVLLNPADVESLLINTDEMGGPPGNSSSGSGSAGGSGGSGGLAQPMPPQPYPYPPTQMDPAYPPKQHFRQHTGPPPLPGRPPVASPQQPQPPVVGMPVGTQHNPAPYPAGPAPPYTSFDPAYPPQIPSAPEKSPMPAASFPELPSVPVSSFPVDSVGKGSAGGEDVDFDDLTKRFEELKKKK